MMPRPGMKHGCNAPVTTVKRSTMTYTPEEQKEFKEFQIARREKVKTVMKEQGTAIERTLKKNNLKGEKRRKTKLFEEAPPSKKQKTVTVVNNKPNSICPKDPVLIQKVTQKKGSRIPIRRVSFKALETQRQPRNYLILE